MDAFSDPRLVKAEQGGERIATSLSFLSTPEFGGETVFPNMPVCSSAPLGGGLRSGASAPCARRRRGCEVVIADCMRACVESTRNARRRDATRGRSGRSVLAAAWPCTRKRATWFYSGARRRAAILSCPFTTPLGACLSRVGAPPPPLPHFLHGCVMLTCALLIGSVGFSRNLFPNGTVDMMATHTACPVVRGEKWSAPKWIHVRPRMFAARRVRSCLRRAPLLRSTPTMAAAVNDTQRD